MLSRKANRRGSPTSYLTRYTLQQVIEHAQFSSDSDGDTSSFLNEFPLSKDTQADHASQDVSFSPPD